MHWTLRIKARRAGEATAIAISPRPPERPGGSDNRWDNVPSKRWAVATMRHTAVTCVMEPSRASMANTMWTNFSAEGVTNTLLRSCRRRSTHTNIAMTQAVTWDSRGTVYGQPLKLEIDTMEDLMMPGCVSIANCHEHTAGEVPHCMMQTGCRMICRRSVQQYQVCKHQAHVFL